MKIFYHPKFQRVMKQDGHSLSIFWSKDMLDFLLRHFPTMFNSEVAGCLGLSERSIIRKAHELGLKKDKQWLDAIWDDNRRKGQIISRKSYNRGQIRPGEHRSPANEFKPGHKMTDEERAKRSESMRRWYRLNPTKVRQKAAKAAESRRRNRLQALEQV